MDVFRLFLFLTRNRVLWYIVSWGPDGFRELREVCRIDLQPASWYLEVFVVLRYGRNRIYIHPPTVIRKTIGA